MGTPTARCSTGRPGGLLSPHRATLRSGWPRRSRVQDFAVEHADSIGRHVQVVLYTPRAASCALAPSSRRCPRHDTAQGRQRHRARSWRRDHPTSRSRKIAYFHQGAARLMSSQTVSSYIYIHVVRQHVVVAWAAPLHRADRKRPVRTASLAGRKWPCSWPHRVTASLGRHGRRGSCRRCRRCPRSETPPHP